MARAQLFDWNYQAGSDSASGSFVVSLLSVSSGTSTFAVTGISNGKWDGTPITAVVDGTTFTSTGAAASQNTLITPLEFTAGPNDIFYIPSGPVEYNATTNQTSEAGPFQITEAPWNPSDAVVGLGAAIFFVQGYRRRRRKTAVICE
jgi:hypothetical protein